MNRIKTIGQGGLGVVSLWRNVDGQLYAVKQMLYTWNMDHFERFKREIQILSNLVHKNIIKVINFNVHSDNNNPWFVMPYFKDGSLRDKINGLYAEGQVYSETAATSLIYYLADALAHAHAKNIIHRDLKPENILFNDQEPIIADWGIGKFIHKESQVLTKEGLGTKTYCAPEQWSNGVSDHRSDIYSLGIIFRELISGSIHGEINNARINNIINTMTMDCPLDRYQSMAEVMQAIRSLEMINVSDPMQAFWEDAGKVVLTVGIVLLLAKMLE